MDKHKRIWTTNPETLKMIDEWERKLIGNIYSLDNLKKYNELIKQK